MYVLGVDGIIVSLELVEARSSIRRVLSEYKLGRREEILVPIQI